MLEKIFKFLLQDTSYHIICISQSYIQETGQDTLDWWRGRSSSTEGGEAYKQCQLHLAVVYLLIKFRLAVDLLSIEGDITSFIHTQCVLHI